MICGVTEDGRYRIEGYLSGPGPSLREDYVSASAPAELYAALWFACWLLQAPAWFRSLPHAVYTDNMMVVDTAAGGTDFASCGRLPVYLDGLVKLVRTRVTLEWHHVAGHCSHPLNEFADAIARLASMGLAPPAE